MGLPVFVLSSANTASIAPCAGRGALPAAAAGRRTAAGFCSFSLLPPLSVQRMAAQVPPLPAVPLCLAPPPLFSRLPPWELTTPCTPLPCRLCSPVCCLPASVPCPPGSQRTQPFIQNPPRCLLPPNSLLCTHHHPADSRWLAFPAPQRSACKCRWSCVQGRQAGHEWGGGEGGMCSCPADRPATCVYA